eukprot:481693_1
MALYCLLLCSYMRMLAISGFKSSKQHVQRHTQTQRQLLQMDTLELNCSDSIFDSLSHHDQFLCVNNTVNIWDIEPTEYQCFTNEEIETALHQLLEGSHDTDSDEHGWSVDTIQYLRQIGSGSDLALDGSGNIGLIAWILLKEVFGFNAILREFYTHAIPIVHYLEPPHIHLEFYPSEIGDFGTSFAASLPDDITGSLNGLQASSSWAIQKEVRDAILQDLNEEEDIFLEWWRTYTLDEVIDVMSHETYIDVPTGHKETDGYEQPCELDIDSCVPGTNTWFPDACTNDTCATLFQFLPGYNNDEDRDIIADNDMRLQITYFGGDWTNQSKYYWLDKLKQETRALWSIWSPTTWTAGGEFITIGYPQDEEDEKAYKLIPTKLPFRSNFAYDFLLNIIMTNDEYDWINKRIWDKEGVLDTFATRLDESCEWLKYQINSTQNAWLNWIPSDLSRFTFSCSSYGDESLQNLHDIASSPDTDDHDYAEYIDAVTAQRILDECLSDHMHYEVSSHGYILLIGPIVSALGVVIQTIFIAIMVHFRDSVLMKTSSVYIILVMLFGGYFGLCFVVLSDAEYLSVVLIRLVFSQSALVLMLAALTGKTWRLQTIKVSALKGNITRIEDKHIVLRIAVLYVVIIGSIIALQMVYPPVLKHEVYDHSLYVIYRLDEPVKIVQTVLLIGEIFAFVYVGSLGWKLRDINKKYNESKYIAIILYNTTLFIILILLLNELSLSPYAQFAAESLLWSIMVMMDTAVLLLPKCYHLYRGTVFLETGLDKQIEMSEDDKYIKVDKRTPSRKDIQAMRDILKKVGYVVAKKDKTTGHVKEVSTISTTTKHLKVRSNEDVTLVRGISEESQDTQYED